MVHRVSALDRKEPGAEKILALQQQLADGRALLARATAALREESDEEPEDLCEAIDAFMAGKVAKPAAAPKPEPRQPKPAK